MNLKRTLILGACLVALLATTAFAQHGPDSFHKMHHGEAAEHHTEMLAKRLGLNDSQKSTLNQLFQDLRAEVQPLAQEHRRLMEENRADLESGRADAKTVGTRMVAAWNLSRQMREAHDELLEKLLPILDADQRKEVEKIREQHRDLGRYDMPGF